MKWVLILVGIAAYLGLAALVGMFCGVGDCDDGFSAGDPVAGTPQPIGDSRES